MKELIIKVDNITYSYKSHAPELYDVTAIKDITIEVSWGEFIVVLGRNGSGKSTLARHLNALLVPDKGYVLIKNMNTADEKYTWEIRNTAGMVFQNPDNQIVGTIVEEDVAFGPENLGIPPAEIRKRVDEALETVGMKDYAKNAPHLLSGGQKQRVAIAGILAMRPGCIILDEATSMLDPVGRKEVLKVLRQLNKKEGITVIHITHHMDEASIADRVFVMEKGSVVLQGKPSEVFENVKRIKDMGLDVPQVTELFYELAKEGLNMPTNILTVDEAANWIISNLKA